MLYKHKKTGNLYRHLAFGVDCTIERDGTPVVLYQPIHNSGAVYVRTQAEHEEKFEIIAEPLARGHITWLDSLA